jgi:hypothetical protein
MLLLSRFDVTANSETERLRDVLNMFYGDEAAKFVYKSWRLGFVTDQMLRDVILGIWQVSWPSFALRERDWLAIFSATGFVSEGPGTVLELCPGHRVMPLGRRLHDCTVASRRSRVKHL